MNDDYDDEPPTEQPPEEVRLNPPATACGKARMAGGRRHTRPRKSSPFDWRLVDEEFDKLHAQYDFTVEACCDPKGANGHAGLPFFSTSNSVLDHDLSGQRVFMNPPFKDAVKMVTHLRRCHAKNPQQTRAVIVLPNWPAFAEITEGLY